MNVRSGMMALTVISLQCLAMLVSAQAMAADMARQDDTSRQRGAETFVNLCMLCHNMKYIQFQDLRQLGISSSRLDELRRGRPLKSGLQSAMTTDATAKLFGMKAPDLSLMAIARKGGDSYIYHLLTAYYEKQDGTVDNHLFPKIRMPDVLGYAIETDRKSKASVEKQARDVAAFLGWAAEPNAVERKRLGFYVLTYLVVLTVLLYLVKKKVWRRLD